MLPRGSYYYSGSGNLLEVVGSHVTWQNLNFADWQIYAGAGNGNLTLNHDCVSFSGTGNAQQYIINEAVGDTGMTIENSTIFSTNPTNLSANGIAAGVGALLDNDYIYNTTDSVSLGNGSTIENSYVISNANAQGAHTEPLYMEDVSVTINHNTLLNPQTQTAEIFAASSSSSCDNHLTVTNNLLAGGGYVIYACSGIGGIGSSTLTFTGNDFARCGGTFHHGSDGGSYCGSTDPSSSGTTTGNGADTHGYWPLGGHFGIESHTYCTGPGQTSADNYWDDTGASVRCGDSPRPPRPSRAAPALSDVTQSHRTWRSSDGKGKHRRPVGTRFGFTLSEAAKVRLTFTVQLPGRRLGRGCVRVTRRNRRHHACTRRGSSNSLTKAGSQALTRSSSPAGPAHRRAWRPGSTRS